MLSTLRKYGAVLLVLLPLAVAGENSSWAGDDGGQAVIAVKPGSTDGQGTSFTLRALRDCTLILNTVEGLWDDGRPRLGRELESRRLRAGERFTFRTMVTENLPGLCVTAEVGMGAELWCPAISGKDGTLLLAPGFRLE